MNKLFTILAVVQVLSFEFAYGMEDAADNFWPVYNAERSKGFTCARNIMKKYFKAFNAPNMPQKNSELTQLIVKAYDDISTNCGTHDRALAQKVYIQGGYIEKEKFTEKTLSINKYDIWDRPIGNGKWHLINSKTKLEFMFHTAIKNNQNIHEQNILTKKIKEALQLQGNPKNSNVKVDDYTDCRHNSIDDTIYCGTYGITPKVYNQLVAVK